MQPTFLSLMSFSIICWFLLCICSKNKSASLIYLQVVDDFLSFWIPLTVIDWPQMLSLFAIWHYLRPYKDIALQGPSQSHASFRADYSILPSIYEQRNILGIMVLAIKNQPLCGRRACTWWGGACFAMAEGITRWSIDRSLNCLQNWQNQYIQWYFMHYILHHQHETNASWYHVW